MTDTSVYTVAKLSEMKASNDDYLANKTMYRELNNIKMVVLGQNNLGYKTATYNFTYDNITKTTSYYDTIVSKLSQMFPGTVISKVNSLDNASGTISFNWTPS